MKQKKHLLPLAAITAVALLWLTGIIPRQIAKASAAAYAKTRFPALSLTCTAVEWSAPHGDYLVTLRAENGTEYRCTIGPRYLPVTLGQGLFALESAWPDPAQ